MPYTIHDSPRLTQRIDADLATVLAAVRKADPHLRSLVLTGGFARGEGTVLHDVPQNDYDLIAIRDVGRPAVNYEVLRARLSKRLKIHIDLAAVAAWRLRWVPSSIFWYETALRGRVLWGEDLLQRIRVRRPADIAPTEGLRLLVNRAAGLLLATEEKDAHAVRIQAAKAILAAFDVHLLAAGHFAPSQRERWRLFQDLLAAGTMSPRPQGDKSWLQWALRFKVDPANAERRDHNEAWQAARRAILDAVPAALRHANLESLAAYGRHDSLTDRAVYSQRVHRVAGARRFVANPTGRVRVATLRLLEATTFGPVDRGAAQRCFSGVARVGRDPLRTLEGLRAATLQ